MSTTESFSGTHPFRPACLADMGASRTAVRRAVAHLDAGRCPRCAQPLLPADAPATGWFPAGSRVTRCRCVPVCAACGMHEGQVQVLSPSKWPLDGGSVYAWADEVMATAVPAVLGTDSAGRVVAVDEQGATALARAYDTGGRAQYGFDASEDS